MTGGCLLQGNNVKRRLGEVSAADSVAGIDAVILREAVKRMVGREFIILNNLARGYNTSNVISHTIAQPWKQTTAYEVVLSHGKLRIGVIGYHSIDSFSEPLDSRPNIEWAVQNPSTSLTKKPFDELDDETILKYILYKLRRHDMPF